MGEFSKSQTEFEEKFKKKFKSKSKRKKFLMKYRPERFKKTLNVSPYK
jgi:hypothetical protein